MGKKEKKQRPKQQHRRLYNQFNEDDGDALPSSAYSLPSSSEQIQEEDEQDDEEVGIEEGDGKQSPPSKFILYQKSVQSPKGDISYLQKFFLMYIGRRHPLHLQEDFCGTALLSNMPPRRPPANANATGSNHDSEIENPVTGQFQQLMQMLVEQQQRANDNQARFQEQMAKKDEELTQVQRQLLEVLGRRPEPVANVEPVQHRDRDPNILFEKFRKRGPKEFTGQEDPLAADDWLAHTENIFDIFVCTGRQRVLLAASMFTGLADIWWKTVKEGYQNIADGIAWATFKQQFSEKYVPAHIKKQKAAEFQLLKQEDMTVLEYLTKFEKLSRYAPELVDTEEKKITKFMDGLNPIILRDALGVVPPTTFQEAIKRAYRFEDINNQIIKDNQRKRQQFQSGQKSYQGKKQKKPQNAPTQGGCEHCGKNHSSQQCYRLSGACFKCGSSNHQVKDCPNNRNQGNRAPQQPPRQAPQQNQQVVQNPPRQQQNQQPRQQPQNQNARPQQQNRNMQLARPNQNQNRPRQQGRLNHINQVDAEAAGDVVEDVEPLAVEAHFEAEPIVPAEGEWQPDDVI